LRETRITSTRGSARFDEFGGALSLSSFCTSGNAMPGASGSFSRSRWNAWNASSPACSNSVWLSAMSNSAREVIATIRR